MADRKTKSLTPKVKASAPRLRRAGLRISYQGEPGANSHSFAIYAAVMVVFFCISFPLTRLAIFLERRLV